MQNAVRETAAAKASSRAVALPGSASQVEQACREAALDMGLRLSEASAGRLTLRDPYGWHLYHVEITVELSRTPGPIEATVSASAVGGAIPVSTDQLDRTVALYVSLIEWRTGGAVAAVGADHRQWARTVFRVFPLVRWLSLALWLAGWAIAILFIRPGLGGWGRGTSSLLGR